MTRKNPLPSFERLHELFVYEPETGLLRWKINRAQMRAGDIAGSLRDSGYISVGVNDKLYRAHLVACKPWQASIGKNGKSKHLGHFATKEAAHAAYCEAAQEIFGEFARAA